MNKNFRSNAVFIAICVAIFLLVCVASTYSMIWVIGWYLSNCSEAATNTCSAANWLISYWWLLFIPGILAATFFVHRSFVKRQAKLIPDPMS